DPRVHENITASVTPLPDAIAFREELASATLPSWPDPSVAADGYRWADVVERRVDEVPQPVRDHVAEALATRLRSGELAETYRGITTAEALAYIAGGFRASADQRGNARRPARSAACWLRTAQGWRMAYTASDVGTARACCAARRTTKPCRASSSMRRPATRSSCRDEKLPGSMACAKARALSWAACGTALPSASATAHNSATRRLKAAQVTSTLRISPIGSRTAAVMPACAQMKASLAHSTALMLADSSAWKPARSHQASRHRARWVARPSSSPNVMLAGPPLCTITPGSAVPAKGTAAPPITWSSPTPWASCSSFSPPFCSDTTAVPSPSNGPSRAAADRAAKVFRESRT